MLCARKFLAKVWQYWSYKMFMLWQWVRTDLLSLPWLVSFIFFNFWLACAHSVGGQDHQCIFVFCTDTSLHVSGPLCLLGSRLQPDLHNIPGTLGNADNHLPREPFLFLPQNYSCTKKLVILVEKCLMFMNVRPETVLQLMDCHITKPSLRRFMYDLGPVNFLGCFLRRTAKVHKA